MQVLDVDCNNEKALFRLGRAYASLNYYDKAIICYKRALKIVPNEKNIIIELKSVEKAQRQYLIIEKRIYSKMFAS